MHEQKEDSVEFCYLREARLTRNAGFPGWGSALQGQTFASLDALPFVFYVFFYFSCRR